MAFFPIFRFHNIIFIFQYSGQNLAIHLRIIHDQNTSFLVCFIDIFSKQMVTATSPLLLSSLTYIRQYIDDIILYFQYSVYHFHYSQLQNLRISVF